MGKFTYEHSIAIDVLETLDFVDTRNVGALGILWAGTELFSWPPDERIRAARAVARPFFRHNLGVQGWSRVLVHLFQTHS